MAAKRTKRRYVSLIGGGLIAVMLIGGFVWFVHMMMSSKNNKPQRQIQTVQIIRPPPPPPDQPPPPPPEKTQEALPKDVPEPTPQDEEPPPSQALGIDAEGGAGSDAFGLAARRGGSDLIGGNGNAAFAWYTNRLKDAVVEKLTSDARIESRKFSISVRVWIEADGRIKQVKLVTTTGNHELDQRIQVALTSLMRMSDAPPLEMPQPISLKIVSHS
jgi:protein TonB